MGTTKGLLDWAKGGARRSYGTMAWDDGRGFWRDYLVLVFDLFDLILLERGQDSEGVAGYKMVNGPNTETEV